MEGGTWGMQEGNRTQSHEALQGRVLLVVNDGRALSAGATSVTGRVSNCGFSPGETQWRCRPSPQANGPRGSHCRVRFALHGLVRVVLVWGRGPGQEQKSSRRRQERCDWSE